jgi:alkanesulfonate monooxygenase SsuD/methylene tetrahydromethanopterin reductase-like flavin-dependent oxidoreductase (luciferase family)
MVLDRACDEIGRDPAEITRSLGLYTLVGEDERDLRHRFDRLHELTPPGVLAGVDLHDWRQGHLVGTVDEVRGQLAGWADAGVDELIVGLGAVPFAVTTSDDLDMVVAACSLGG